MELETAFGQTLRDFRKRAKLSQEALALECDLDRTFISLLERGRRQPTLRTLFRIATVLNVSPSQFIAVVETRMKRP